MNRSIARRLLAPLTAGALLLGTGAFAAYTPALPEAGKIPLSDVVERPKNVRWANGTAEVNCQVLVTRKGKAAGSKCGLAEGIKGSTSESVLGAGPRRWRRARSRRYCP